MNIIPELLTWVLLVSGGFVLIIGALGMWRFPDFFTRLHAASVIDTLGFMLIILGLLIQAGLTIVSIKLILLVVIILFTSPTAAHALAKSALHGGLKPELHDQGELS